MTLEEDIQYFRTDVGSDVTEVLILSNITLTSSGLLWFSAFGYAIKSISSFSSNKLNISLARFGTTTWYDYNSGSTPALPYASYYANDYDKTNNEVAVYTSSTSKLLATGSTFKIYAR